MKRHVYLSMKPLEEAKEVFFSIFEGEKRTGIEDISTEEALGRVTAEPIFAILSAPHYHSAAMDGIALKAEKTYGTTERNPRTLAMGEDALWVNTGQSIPDGFDAVIMIEKVHELDGGHVEIRAPAYPWQHVRKVGEDIVATQLLLPQDHQIRSYDLGALITGGVFSLKVRKRPRVIIIPTGSEIVSHKELKDPARLKKHQILDSNSLVLAGLVRECLGVPIIYDIVADRENEIRGALSKAVASDADIIIINAGSSAGSKDFTADTIGEMGDVLVHGVAMMPGKPTILGRIKDKPVVGNPGYTVSAILSFREFVRPLLYGIQGLRSPKMATMTVQLSRDIPSKLGIEEFLRVNIGRVGAKNVATPLPRAAGSITSLTQAEGILRIPALSEGVSQDEKIDAELFVDEEEILRTVVIIGSHDITIDILADEVRRKRIRISSGNVGSLGGIMALRKGNCHMAGSHLLDPETGEYNVSYVKRYLRRVRVGIFHLVLRDQGLIVARGNPKGIRGIDDLTRNHISFVNRQPGSGTRVLFDYKLKGAGIEPEAIKGYHHEEFTHMAVAVDVLSGAADCGMGIYAAAKALGLDFIPMVQEQYDLIIPSSMVSEAQVEAVMAVIRSRDFRERVRALGGYDPSKSGDLWKEVS